MPTIYIPRRIERPPLGQRVRNALRQRKWLVWAVVGSAVALPPLALLGQADVRDYLAIRRAQEAVRRLPDVAAIPTTPAAEGVILEILSGGRAVFVEVQAAGDAVTRVAPFSATPAAAENSRSGSPSLEALDEAVRRTPAGARMWSTSRVNRAVYVDALVNYYAPLVRLVKSMTPKQLKTALGKEGIPLGHLTEGQRAEVLRAFVGAVPCGARALDPYGKLLNLANVDARRSAVAFGLDGEVWFFAVPRGEQFSTYRGARWRLGNGGLPLADISRPAR